MNFFTDKSSESSAAAQFSAALSSLLPCEDVFVQEPLSKHTTFAIGGAAQWFVTPRNENQIASVVNLCLDNDVPYRILGQGSNVLAPDEGMPGVTIHLGSLFQAITLCEKTENAPDADTVVLIAQAGATNEAVARTACAAGLSGYEFASGIPGSIGGAAIMNAGAYGGQFQDVAIGVRCYDPRTRSFVDISAQEACWSYRHSMMMEQGLVVLSARLALHPGNPSDIQELIDDLAQRRAEKQPLEMPSAGSTFKRPEGHYAGQLIQEAGLMGCRIGGAQVSTKHAGFVVNAGDATADDVQQLIGHIQERVFASSGVFLEPEVRLWS